MTNIAPNTSSLPLLRYMRRRYGRTTYTWVRALIDGVWLDLDDPWPCKTPKQSEVAEAVAIVTARHRAQSISP